MIRISPLERFGSERLLIITHQDPFRQQTLTIHPQGLLVYTNDEKDSLSGYLRTQRRYIPLLSIQGVKVDELSLRIWAVSITEGYVLDVSLCEKNKEGTYQLLSEKDQDMIQRFVASLNSDIAAQYKIKEPK